MKIPRAMAVAAAALAVGVAAAGCGSSSNNSSSSAPLASAGTNASGGSGRSYGYGGGSTQTPAASAVTLQLASSPLGRILVDQDGKTLYLFEADGMNKSNCNGGCLALLPPVTTNGKATAGSGASAALIGSSMRSDGSSQVTYAGHPVYWFSGDTKAGDTNGEGLTDFGGAWYAVSPAGNAVVKQGS